MGEVTIDVRILVDTTGTGIPFGFHYIYGRKKGVNIVSVDLLKRRNRQNARPDMGISLIGRQILYTCEVQNCGPHPGEHSIT